MVQRLASACENTVGREDERWQITGEVRQRQHLGPEPNPQDVRHKAPPRANPFPCLHMALGQLRPSPFVEKCNSVLNIGCEVWTSSRRNDVELNCLARLK